MSPKNKMAYEDVSITSYAIFIVFFLVFLGTYPAVTARDRNAARQSVYKMLPAWVPTRHLTARLSARACQPAPASNGTERGVPRSCRTHGT